MYTRCPYCQKQYPVKVTKCSCGYIIDVTKYYRSRKKKRKRKHNKEVYVGIFALLLFFIFFAVFLFKSAPKGPVHIIKKDELAPLKVKKVSHKEKTTKKSVPSKEEILFEGWFSGTMRGQKMMSLYSTYKKIQYKSRKAYLISTTTKSVLERNGEPFHIKQTENILMYEDLSPIYMVNKRVQGTQRKAITTTFSEDKVKSEIIINGRRYNKSIKNVQKVILDESIFIYSLIKQKKFTIGKQFYTYDIRSSTDTLAIVQKHILVQGKKFVHVYGKKREVWEVIIKEKGGDITAFIDKDGFLLSLMIPKYKITFTRCSRKQSEIYDSKYSLSISHSTDYIYDSEKVTRMELMCTLDKYQKFIKAFENNHYQTLTLKNNEIYIVMHKNHPKLSKLSFPEKSLQYQKYLKTDPYIQSDQKIIQEKARKIVGTVKNRYKAVKILQQWVFQNLRKSSTSVLYASATETLRAMAGDCTEHSILFCAFARSLGIPTRICGGLVYLDGEFGWHAWNEVYIGKWLLIDCALNREGSNGKYLILSYRDEKKPSYGLIYEKITFKILKIWKRDALSPLNIFSERKKAYYRNNTLGVSFRYPKKWKIYKDKRRILLSALSDSKETKAHYLSSKFGIFITSFVFQRESPITQEQAMNKYLTLMRSDYKKRKLSFRILSKQETLIGKDKVLQANLEYFHRKYKKRYFGDITIVVKENALYSIYKYYPAADTSLREQLNNVYKSLVFLQKKKSKMDILFAKEKELDKNVFQNKTFSNLERKNYASKYYEIARLYIQNNNYISPIKTLEKGLWLYKDRKYHLVYTFLLAFWGRLKDAEKSALLLLKYPGKKGKNAAKKLLSHIKKKRGREYDFSRYFITLSGWNIEKKFLRYVALNIKRTFGISAQLGKNYNPLSKYILKGKLRSYIKLFEYYKKQFGEASIYLEAKQFGISKKDIETQQGKKRYIIRVLQTSKVGKKLLQSVKKQEQQWDVEKILRDIRESYTNQNTPHSLGKIVLTSADIAFFHKDFILGATNKYFKIALVSNYRLAYKTTKRTLLYRRTILQVYFYLASIFALPKCKDHFCPLFATTSLKEIDQKSEELCFSCLKSLLSHYKKIVGANPYREKYQRAIHNILKE